MPQTQDFQFPSTYFVVYCTDALLYRSEKALHERRHHEVVGIKPVSLASCVWREVDFCQVSVSQSP